MAGKRLKVVATERAVPKLELREYEIVVRHGEEWIVDGYGGFVPVKELHLAKVTFERL
ncbi:hypothetical protein EBOKLHFM_00268 [Klebsiella phage KP13-26]|nr:hypothetical protein EBOKLHFM_00268 [Klebsiella phage KP13-26]